MLPNIEIDVENLMIGVGFIELIEAIWQNTNPKRIIF